MYTAAFNKTKQKERNHWTKKNENQSENEIFVFCENGKRKQKSEKNGFTVNAKWMEKRKEEKDNKLTWIKCPDE